MQLKESKEVKSKELSKMSLRLSEFLKFLIYYSNILDNPHSTSYGSLSPGSR